MLAQSPQLRQGLYLASAALNAIGLIVMAASATWGTAILSAGASLAVAANMTAANNIAAPTAKKTTP